MNLLIRSKNRLYVRPLIICSILLCLGCKATHNYKSDFVNDKAQSYSEILTHISEIELSDYEQKQLFHERVLFNIDNNSLSFLFSKSVNADTARMQLNKLYSFNKIFNTIYKRDKSKFYPLTQELDDFYFNKLSTYDCTINSFDHLSKCKLINKVLANQSLNKVETFVGETNINLLTNFSIKTDAKTMHHKNHKIKYSILRVIRPWFEYGILSMIQDNTENKQNKEKRFLINQVIIIHQNNKALILGYVLHPI